MTSLVTLIFKYLIPATVTGRQSLYETSNNISVTGHWRILSYVCSNFFNPRIYVLPVLKTKKNNNNQTYCYRKPLPLIKKFHTKPHFECEANNTDYIVRPYVCMPACYCISLLTGCTCCNIKNGWALWEGRCSPPLSEWGVEPAPPPTPKKLRSWAPVEGGGI